MEPDSFWMCSAKGQMSQVAAREISIGYKEKNSSQGGEMLDHRPSQTVVSILEDVQKHIWTRSLAT